MSQFDVFVQDSFYKTISAKNTGEVLAIVARDIKGGLVPGFDSTKDQNLRVVLKQPEDAFGNMDKNGDGSISRDEFNS